MCKYNLLIWQKIIFRLLFNCSFREWGDWGVIWQSSTGSCLRIHYGACQCYFCSRHHIWERNNRCCSFQLFHAFSQPVLWFRWNIRNSTIYQKIFIKKLHRHFTSRIAKLFTFLKCYFWLSGKILTIFLYSLKWIWILTWTHLKWKKSLNGRIEPCT